MSLHESPADITQVKLDQQGADRSDLSLNGVFVPSEGCGGGARHLPDIKPIFATLLQRAKQFGDTWAIWPLRAIVITGNNNVLAASVPVDVRNIFIHKQFVQQQVFGRL